MDNSVINKGQDDAFTTVHTSTASTILTNLTEVHAAKAKGVEVPAPETTDHLEFAVPRTDEKEPEAGESSAVKEEHIELIVSSIESSSKASHDGGGKYEGHDVTIKAKNDALNKSAMMNTEHLLKPSAFDL